MAPAPDGPLRAVLVGYGLAGRVFHAPLLRAAGIRVAAVVTSDPGRAEAAREENPGTRVLASAERVWADPEPYDLVVVATANRAHVPLARAALDAGLHVVVDKPLAVTSDAAAALLDAAAEAGRVLTVFQNRRHDAEYLTTRRLLAAGDLGRVVRFESRFTRWRPEGRPGAWRESADPADGGGLLLDLGVHLVDQAVHLFGPPTHVYAEVAAVRAPTRGAGGWVPDDDVFIALTHPGGEVSHLWASAVAGDPGPRLRVLGTRGAYVAPVLDGQEDALRAGADPAAPDWGVEPPGRWGRLVRGDGGEPVPSEPGGWTAFYPAVEAAVRTGAPPPVPPEEAVRVLRVLEAAARGAATREVVALRPDGAVAAGG